MTTPDSLLDCDSIALQRYQEIQGSAGRSATTVIFEEIQRRLPYPVEVNTSDASTIAGVATGIAWTDFSNETHHIPVARQLRGRALEHTLAHEYFHLLYHLPTPDNINDMIEHYAAQPEASGLPRSVIRRKVLSTIRPMKRACQDSHWERQAETFAGLVVTNSRRRSLPPSTVPILVALGAPDARG